MEKTGDAEEKNFSPSPPDVHGGYFAPTAGEGRGEGCSIRLSAEKGKERGEERGEGE